MPPMGERMAAVEATVSDVKSDVAEVKADVKLLVSWMNEERGAKAQRQTTQRRDRAILGGVASVLGFLGSAFFSFFFGNPGGTP